jgi:hypothetical protein
MNDEEVRARFARGETLADQQLDLAWELGLLHAEREVLREIEEDTGARPRDLERRVLADGRSPRTSATGLSPATPSATSALSRAYAARRSARRSSSTPCCWRPSLA